MFDAQADRFPTRTGVAKLEGYADTPIEVSWDAGRSEYLVRMRLLEKTVAFHTTPPDVVITGPSGAVSADVDGRKSLPMVFRPDAQGALPSFTFDATLERPGEIWEPQQFTIAWDDGRAIYDVTLKEILERPVAVRGITWSMTNRQWKPTVVKRDTMAYKLPTDGPGDTNLQPAVRVTDLPAGTSIDSFSISPDGRSLVMALIEDEDASPEVRIAVAPTTGAPTLAYLTDGTSMDLTPSFGPDGSLILFSSDRGGERFNIWSIPADGSAGATRLTGGQGDHLWPGLDASAADQRVFYQALLPRQSAPRLYSAVVGRILETELSTNPATQPRLSPLGDRLAFAGSRDGIPRDLFVIATRGGNVQQITATPDLDERDPAWSNDAQRIAFAADINGDTDCFMTDSNGNGVATPITRNPGIDDMPVFHPIDDAVYFRSNRGGKWDVWRIPVR
jgi:hypothetical protein